MQAHMIFEVKIMSPERYLSGDMRPAPYTSRFYACFNATKMLSGVFCCRDANFIPRTTGVLFEFN